VETSNLTLNKKEIDIVPSPCHPFLCHINAPIVPKPDANLL